MCKTPRAKPWARGGASEKKGGVIEAVRERLMVHINWGWFVWSTESGCSSQVCRGAVRQMWGPLCPPQGQWRAARQLRNVLSVLYMCVLVCKDEVWVCVCVFEGEGWGGRQPAFLFLSYNIFALISILALRPWRRRTINLCSQFALWPRSYMFLPFVWQEENTNSNSASQKWYLKHDKGINVYFLLMQTLYESSTNKTNNKKESSFNPKFKYSFYFHTVKIIHTSHCCVTMNVTWMDNGV